MHFDDACAATQLEVVKDIIADEGYNIDPEAAKRLKEDVYVDDCLSGGTETQVARFVGKKLPDGQYDGTFSKILGLGNFRVKAFGISGQKPTAESDLLGDKVLGYGYSLETDMMTVNFSLNLSGKRRSVRKEADLTVADIDRLKSRPLTKRLLLGVVNGFGDVISCTCLTEIRKSTLICNPAGG